MKETIGFPFAAPALTTALEPRRHYAMVRGGGSATLLLMTDTILHPFSFLLQEVDFGLELLPDMSKMPFSVELTVGKVPRGIRSVAQKFYSSQRIHWLNFQAIAL